MTIASGQTATASDVLAAVTGAVTPVFSSIAALRNQAVTAPPAAVFVSGYYSIGDGGGGLFQYNSTDTSSTDNSGTIIVDTLGRRYYRQYSAAPLNAAWFGMLGDGTATNDTAFDNLMAVALAFPDGAQILFPPGRFRFSSQRTVSYPSARPFNLEFRGSGAVLYWTASTGGIVFAYSLPAHYLLLEGMTFTTGANGGGNAITITQTDPLRDFINTNIRAVTFLGDDNINGHGGLNYWTNCAKITNVSGTNWEGCTFYGGANGANNFAGTGINFTGTGVNVDTDYSIYHNIAKGIFNGLASGVTYGSYAQGINIGQCNFQNTNVGFFAGSSETGMLSQLQIFDSQFACTHDNILTETAIGNVFIENNDIFAVAGYSGIYLQNFSGAIITGNNIACLDVNANGIVLESMTTGAPSTITGNTITGGTTAIWLKATTSNVVVAANAITSSVNRVLNSGTSNTIIDTGSGVATISSKLQLNALGSAGSAVLSTVGSAGIVNLVLTPQGATAAVFSAGPVAPYSDNTYVCGTSLARWSAVYAVNGTIQTSDPNQKTDISHIDGQSALTLLDSIQPITFKWIVGGHDISVDANGENVYSPRAGRRTHWGFDAAEIKAAFDAIGADFGGFVLTEDGVRSLRPDQLIPVVWQAAKELSSQISKLKSDIDALKAAGK